MIRALFLALALVGAALHAVSIDEKIKDTNKALKNFDRNYASVNSKMADTANAILKKERAVLKQQKKITELQKAIEGKSETLKTFHVELAHATEAQEKLQTVQADLEDELSSMLARIASLAVVHEDANALGPDAVIGEEVFKALSARARQTLSKLGETYETNRKVLGTLTGKTAKLRHEIAKIAQEKRRLASAIDSNEKALNTLRVKKKKYAGELRKVLASKDALDTTLTELNVLKETEAKKARKAQEKKRNDALLASKKLPKVKSVGSSYQRVKTRRYRGKKTFAPLDSYTVSKRYGTYTDPIYQIKIFNESVTLKPSAPDAKVKAVFNGKVILAQNTPMLDNVVIMQNADGIHTIYAHLDQIAPTVSKGKRLKKGSVIGRVSDQLMFQVTQKNDHLDPMQVIK